MKKYKQKKFPEKFKCDELAKMIPLEVEAPSALEIKIEKSPISSPHFSSYEHYVLSPKKKTIIGF